MMIPGEGDSIYKEDEFGNKYNWCQEVVKSISCPEHGILKLVRNNCSRVTCPDCFMNWVHTASSRMSSLVHGCADALQYYHGEPITLFGRTYNEYQLNRAGKRCAHLILSPPPGTISEFDTIQHCYDLGKRHVQKFLPGVIGGVFLFHPYRIKKECKDGIRDYVKRILEQDPDKIPPEGYWKMARADVLHLGGLREYMVFGPHFHILCFGFIKDTADYQEYMKSVGKEPWFLKNVRYKTPTGGLDLVIYDNTDNSYDDHVNRVAAYLLTHTAVETTVNGTVSNTYRKFGIMSSSYCTQKKEITDICGTKHEKVEYLRNETRELLCPKCIRDEKSLPEKLLLCDNEGNPVPKTHLEYGSDPDEPVYIRVKLQIPARDLHNVKPREKKAAPKKTDDYGFDVGNIAPVKPDVVSRVAWKKNNKFIHVPRSGQCCFVNESEVVT